VDCDAFGFRSNFKKRRVLDQRRLESPPSIPKIGNRGLGNVAKIEASLITARGPAKVPTAVFFLPNWLIAFFDGAEPESGLSPSVVRGQPESKRMPRMGAMAAASRPTVEVPQPCRPPTIKVTATIQIVFVKSTRATVLTPIFGILARLPAWDQVNVRAADRSVG